MDIQPSDPHAVLVAKLRVGEFPADALHRLVSDLTGYIRHDHATFYADADDIASEAVLEAYESIGNFRGESMFFSWVVAIVKHLIAKRYKKRQQIAQQQWDDVPIEEAAVCMWREQQRDDYQLFEWDLDAALETLNETQRQVFVLRMQQQLQSKVVAEQLGLSNENVRQILVRACRLIAQRLVAAGWQHLERTGVREVRQAYAKAVVAHTGTPAQQTAKLGNT